MTLANKKPKKRPQNNQGPWRRFYALAMATNAGLIIENGMPTKTLEKVAGYAIARLTGNRNHELPNQDTEIIEAILIAQGHDETEIAQMMAETVPDELVAQAEGLTVETVKENRQQLRAARRQYGAGSKEVREARRDLISDRKESRRSRRRKAGGVGNDLSNALAIGAKLL
jgi:hypothetical protein